MLSRCSRRFCSTRRRVDYGNGILGVEARGPEDSKTIAVVCGWMSATQRQLNPYLSWYHKHGIDTLSFSVGPSHVLNPKSATVHMEKVLDTILSVDPNKVVLHHFSVGGFLCGQALRIMASNPKKYGLLLDKKIKAQIYDSPPAISGVPTGLASHLFPEPKGIKLFLHTSVRKALSAYLAITKNTSGIEHQASSEAFHNNILQAPSLWFYSKSDVFLERPLRFRAG